MAKICCISDTHNNHSNIKIESCDIVIHAGDGTNFGRESEVKSLINWLSECDATYKIYVPGNHDIGLEKNIEEYSTWFKDAGIMLLNERSVVVDGFSVHDHHEYELKIYGCPITPRFGSWAFMANRGMDINKHWDKIDDSIDILVTHGPPYGMLDSVPHHIEMVERVGCEMLIKAVERVKPKLHVFGHVHESAGSCKFDNVEFVNAAQCNEYNALVHKPIYVNLK